MTTDTMTETGSTHLFRVELETQTVSIGDALLAGLPSGLSEEDQLFLALRTVGQMMDATGTRTLQETIQALAVADALTAADVENMSGRFESADSPVLVATQTGGALNVTVEGLERLGLDGTTALLASAMLASRIVAVGATVQRFALERKVAALQSELEG